VQCALVKRGAYCWQWQDAYWMSVCSKAAQNQPLHVYNLYVHVEAAYVACVRVTSYGRLNLLLLLSAARSDQTFCACPCSYFALNRVFCVHKVSAGSPGSTLQSRRRHHS
jgi:hypothetical protein